MKAKRLLGEGIPTVLLILFALLVVSPVGFVAAGSFCENAVGYPDFFLWESGYLRALVQSMLLAGCASVGTVLVSLPAAYVFAKVHFKGRDWLFFGYILLMMLPFQVTLLPQYTVARTLGTYDTALALILPGMFSPFAVFLLTQVMRGVPDDVLEAARLDTSSTVKILTQIIVPIIRPGIVCAWVLSFTEQWNAVAEPLVLLERPEIFPLSILLGNMETVTPVLLAGCTLYFLLPLLLYLLFADEIQEGLGAYRLK